MRRGLKRIKEHTGDRALRQASNRSPMRRGLKPCRRSGSGAASFCFKPIPDEEGTETRDGPRAIDLAGRFKPIPDEEGTETPQHGFQSGRDLRFKPIPDEEGTETLPATTGDGTSRVASNRSPMRRGLKRTMALP